MSGSGTLRVQIFGFLGLAACALLWQPGGGAAHEVRPSYLELRETRVDEFDILFKTPMRGDLRLALAATLSGRADIVMPMTTRAGGDAAIQTWRVRMQDPLRGQTIGIAGLANTMTDALVRVTFLDGSSWVRRLTPQEPHATVPASQNGWSVALVYLKLGIQHILLGLDHLLFVFGLLIITRGTWRLVQTVTAFTVAHSITLALATLGIVNLPSAPVEAVIALSIVFLASEALRLREGREGLTARAPWLVAFAFGLLHGLGFAGALLQVGLPAGHIPVALLFFNLGVEVGQLLFVASMLCIFSLLARVRTPWPPWASLAAPYAIGSVAMFWVIERVAAF